MSTGGQWTKTSANEVRTIVNTAKTDKLIAVLEVHDCTGYGEKAEAKSISTAVDYWLSSDIKAELVGQESYVIVNIANEPFGNGVTAKDYVNQTKDAIRRMRRGGLTHTLMIDAPGWGQDDKKTMLDSAKSILSADSLSNTLLSVHMYGVYTSESTVDSYLKAANTAKLPLLVGEFADHSDNVSAVAAEPIMRLCAKYGFGYMGWSWKGNTSGTGSSGLDSLDIAKTWDGKTLSAWGNLLINNAAGIKATSQPATIYTAPDGKKMVLALVQGQGSVTATATGRVDSGKADTLKATPAAGYEFTGWSGDTAGTVISGMTLIIPKVTKDYSIQANFAPGAGTNLLKGGTFTGADSSSWTMSVWPTDANTAKVSFLNGSALVTPSKVDTNLWSIQLTQAGLTLESGTTYELSLDAKATSNRPFSVGVVHNGNVDQNWTIPAYLYKEEDLTSEVQTFTYRFTADTSDASVILQVNLGKYTTAVTVDNISLVKVTGTSVLPRRSLSSPLSLRAVAKGFEWVRAAPLSSATTVRLVDVNGHELYRTMAKAGSATGFVPSAGTGLRFVVLETASDREVHTLTSTR